MGYAEAQYTIDEEAKTNGIPPDNMVSAIAAKDGNNTLLYFAPPNDTVINGNIICKVEGVLIVKKIGSAPKNEKDGTLVADVFGDEINKHKSKNTAIIDTYIENSYYGFFPYSDHGVVNINSKNIKQPTSVFYKFAYHQDFTELDPDKTITYLDWGDLDSSAEPMHTNGDTGTITAGSFNNFYVLQQNKPYMVKSDFTADYALDPNDYTKKLDGTASDVSNTSYSGLGAYAWIPRFYMKEVYAQDGNSRDVYFSNEQEDGFQPVGFMDYSIGVTKGAWIPMYYTGSDGKSIAGRTGYDGTTEKTTDQQKIIVDLNGSNARFLGGSIMSALRDLMYGLYKSTNIQEHGGYGNCNGYDSNRRFIDYGMTSNPVLSNGAVEGFLGTGNSSDVNSRKQANKAFHSNVLFTYDMYLRDPYTLFYTTGSRKGTVRIRTRYTYNINGNAYESYDAIFAASASRARTNGYSSKLEISDSGNGIKQSSNYGDNGGSNATGLCDYDSWGSTSSKTYVAQRLGDCNGDLKAGPARLNLGTEASSSSSWHIGAAVLLIPPADYEPV